MTINRDIADPLVASAVAEITRIQAAHFRRRRHYWQGLGEYSRKPSDQTESWTDKGLLCITHPNMRYTVNNYDGPLGKGWELLVTRQEGAETWVRVVNRGPETYRERSWEVHDAT